MSLIRSNIRIQYKFLLNIIWFIFGGFINAILLFILATLFSITIIGLPLGMQLFKLSRLVLFPFGKEVKINFEKYPIMNFLWIILFGWGFLVSTLTTALFYAITIIGIPFAIQWVKIAKLLFIPFGSEVR